MPPSSGSDVAARPATDPDIEGTLLFASVPSNGEHGELRLLDLLVAWLESTLHGSTWIALTRLVADQSPRVRALWAALARVHAKDARFASTPLLVPANLLRGRALDVLTPEELAQRHRGYYWRMVIGPSYRADCWAAAERHPDSSAAEIGRRAHASFATAWQVLRDIRAVSALPSK